MQREKKHGSKALKADEPVAVWSGKDLFESSPMDSVTIIFRTIGCHWRTCLMCGFVNDCCERVTSEDLTAQLDYVLNKLPDVNDLMVKIYTSGSFFDEREIPLKVREEILSRLSTDPRVRKVIAETRPEFVTSKDISNCAHLFEEFDVAIGVETSNDMIRNRCINKGFSFEDFTKASDIATKCGAGVKAYLLLKPPFLSERVALEDVLRSARDVSEYASTISVNLCNVQNFTKVYELWQRGEYRPPWLWSTVEALRRVKAELKDTIILSDPVAAGQSRGPHNCRVCDRKVADAINEFSLTQDATVLNRPKCECKELWKKVIELEDFALGSKLL
ncbi:MAG: archaeosine biosynthesis radical SAM protein RaSEA [Halobacteriota archaeon]|nr:archaeosine biosynthesis radical SAM protein RaSEA [Halobacteriota archaeon]